MRIISINDSHGSSAIYYVDGEVISAIQEERFTKIKNQDGFPHMALNYFEEKFNFKFEEIDYFVYTSNYIPYGGNDREKRIRGYKRQDILSNLKKIAKLFGLKKLLGILQKRKRVKIAMSYGVPYERIIFLDHHLCHASAAYFGSGFSSEDVLIFTNDGAGDDLCATISIGRFGQISRIASVHMNNSIGELWAILTAMMGMVPLEHEYKLMGLAPYSPTNGSDRVRKILWDLFEFKNNGLEWCVKKGKPAIPYSYKYLRDNLEFMRFDWIAGGLQSFTEDFLCKWIENAVEQTGIKNIVLAGGTFMNVKVNKKINELGIIEKFFVFPSCGDETLPFGGAYYQSAKFNIKPSQINSLYLGKSFKNDQILEYYKKFKFSSNVKINFYEEIEYVVSKLLSDGNIVAWFQDKEEFGARALGARSILADPTKKNVINEINEMIKSRDFWMPFACSMLKDGANRYLINPKGTPARFMIITFDTTEYGEEIEGGRHPYDHTCRPQIVDAEYNLKYHRLLEEFYKITKRYGILNTSLNLHGLPMASTPEDAFNVLDKSGMKYLAIENWLISKN